MVQVSPLPSIDSELSDASIRDYYRKLTAGVSVVTACGDAGWTGATVSTVTSVSLEPPVLLCCFAAGSRTLSAIRSARRFAVHLLADGQADLADRFSGRPDEGSRFAELGYGVRLSHGTPVISGALAVAWCELHSTDEIGDHSVVYGRVSGVRVETGRPLLWHERGYEVLRDDGGPPRPRDEGSRP